MKASEAVKTNFGSYPERQMAESETIKTNFGGNSKTSLAFVRATLNICPGNTQPPTQGNQEDNDKRIKKKWNYELTDSVYIRGQ